MEHQYVMMDNRLLVEAIDPYSLDFDLFKEIQSKIDTTVPRLKIQPFDEASMVIINTGPYGDDTNGLYKTRKHIGVINRIILSYGIYDTINCDQCDCKLDLHTVNGSNWYCYTCHKVLCLECKSVHELDEHDVRDSKDREPRICNNGTECPLSKLRMGYNTNKHSENHITEEVYMSRYTKDEYDLCRHCYDSVIGNDMKDPNSKPKDDLKYVEFDAGIGSIKDWYILFDYEEYNHLVVNINPNSKYYKRYGFLWDDGSDYGGNFYLGLPDDSITKIMEELKVCDDFSDLLVSRSWSVGF